LRKEKIERHSEMKQGYENNEDRNDYLNPIHLIHTGDPSPLEKIETRDISNLINKNIEKLPTPYITIITLYHLEQMSYQEIAEIMNLPEGTVKSYLFRGRKKLKESLVKELEGEEI
jgi:RNA polymerase sigma-70 factor (ECF subfamily)